MTPDPAERDVEADIEAVTPGPIVKFGALAQSVAGLTVALSGLQLVGTRWVASAVNAVPYVLMLVGVGSIAMALAQYRARGWAGPGSVALSVVSLLVMLGWVVFTLTSVWSCLAFVAVPLCGLSAALAIASVPAIRDAAAARKRLSARGLLLGL